MNSAISASLSSRRAVEVIRIAELKARSRAVAASTLSRPMSASVKRIWRLRLLASTRSPSISHISPTPMLASAQGGRAAEPADPQHRDLRLAQPPLALRRGQPARADVAEVAQLAVEARQLRRRRAARRPPRPRRSPAPAAGRSGRRRPPRRTSPAAARACARRRATRAAARSSSSGFSMRMSLSALGRIR